MRDELRAPRDLDAEKSLLGAVLVNPKLLADIEDVVGPEDFFRDAHQRIYRHILKLSDRGIAIDYLPLKDSLERAQELDKVDGPAYLTALIDGIPHSSNASAYAQIVREHAVRRQVLQASRLIQQQAESAELDAGALLEESQQLLWAIAMRQQVGGGLVPASVLVHRAMQRLEELANRHDGIDGIATGFTDVDAMLLGLKPGDLVILAARPAMGKTSLAMNVAAYAARVGQAVAVFSLEMSESQLMFRVAAGEAHVSLERMLSGRTHETEYVRLSKALSEIAEWPLHVEDTALVTVADVRARCRRLQSKHGLALVVVDYLQLMYDGKRHDSRVLELAAISRGLKQLAKELRVPVVALSQLSREVERRPSKRPMLSDLRDSGALEQDADVVLLLWRSEEYEATEQNRGLAELIVAKHRNGSTGAVTLRWFKDETRFGNYQRYEHAEQRDLI